MKKPVNTKMLMNETSHIKQAINALRAGQLVLFPTDTVWGIGVAAAYAPSPQPIYAAKQREAGKPVAWLVAGADALDVYGTNVSDAARNLAYAFWPGALTLVVNASSAVPAAYQSATGTIGLRMPANSAALELALQVGPLATSSANVSGQPAPGSAAEIDASLAAAAACVFNDGSTPTGIASTVVDCTGSVPVVLRQGAILL